MARTRTSNDPYESTTQVGLTHAKPPLYAGSAARVRRPGGVTGAVVLTAALMLVSSDVLGQAAGPAVASPCAACLVMTLTPAQVAALPERLAGARLLLRIDASVSPATWESQLAELRRKGAGVGLHIVGVPGEADPALAERIDILLIEVPASTPLDNIAYRLKAAFTRARAASETATLVLAGARAVMTAVRTDLDPYVDAVLPIEATSEVSESQRNEPGLLVLETELSPR